MAGLIEAIVQWRLLLVALFGFGFAPRAVLRIILLAYSSGNVRREELEAEYFAVKRIERPIWVVEQLETALFDGVADRIKDAGALRRARRAMDEGQDGMRRLVRTAEIFFSTARTCEGQEERIADVCHTLKETIGMSEARLTQIRPLVQSIPSNLQPYAERYIAELERSRDDLSRLVAPWSTADD